MQLVLMVATVGATTAAILNGSWGTLQTSSGGWSLCQQAVTLITLGGGVTHWTSPTVCWVMGVLTGWSEHLAHLVEVVQPAFPLNSNYEVFAWGLSIGGNLCSCNHWPGGLEHLITTREPIWRLLLPSWFHGYMCSGFLYRGGSLWWLGTLGVASLGWVMGDSSGRATPLNMSSSVKGTKHFISSLSSTTLPTNRHGWPSVGGLAFSAQNWRALV